MHWRCADFSFDLTKPLIMGIVNVTPDSFSDGGAHNTCSSAVSFAQKLISDGADIIDVGGESTRPGSSEVSVQEEIKRVLPVVEGLVQEGICVSVDTRHACVAKACLECGAAIINDVSGFRDPKMVELAAKSTAGLVIMHMLGEPKTMQNEPHYTNVVQEVGNYLTAQATILKEAGVEQERICIDPGVGFGKTCSHNLALLKHTEELAALGYPLMVAVSRKAFIGIVNDIPVPTERVSGSVAAALYALEHGARIARVHDVKATAQALELLLAIEEEK